MILRIRKLYISVSPYFIALVLFSIITARIEAFAACFLAIVLHETGHIAIIYMLKEKVILLNILPFGFSCKLWNQKYINSKKMIRILIAGPATNLIAAGLFFFWTKEFAMINLMVGLFNLIPVGELDGGRLIKFI